MGLFDRFRKNRDAADDTANTAANDAVDHDADDAVDDVDSDADDAVTTVDTSASADPDSGAVDADAEDAQEAEDDADDEDAQYAKSAPLNRSTAGPFDVDDEVPDGNRLDLGAIRVPVLDGMQIRLDAEEESGRILAVTLVHEGGTVQLQAFAAPRSEGLWNTVRGQIADTVAGQKGEIDEIYTDLGHELIAKIPAETSDGRPGVRLARFVGVDGPRWFLRGVFSGKAITDDEVRARFVELFRGVVVARGHEAMAPRDLLVLTPPSNAEPADEDESGEEINPFERGPEITEVR